MKMKGIHIIQISYSLLGVVFLVLKIEKEKTNRLNVYTISIFNLKFITGFLQ